MKSNLSVKHRLKAGHYEVIGETLAKYEFFEAGWNPYERFLDVDKTDFILRKRTDEKIVYREIQVKYGKLYDVGSKWEKSLFSITSWRFFNPNEFAELRDRTDFYIAYILAHDDGYEKDTFIFSAAEFHDLLHAAIPSKEKVKVYLSCDKAESKKDRRWYLRRKAGKMDEISEDNCLEVTKHYRSFHKLED
tara:strand:- start:722 stop:1294 length:573 start_codon:yes stop_codon:yes gene_type:complete